MIKVDIQGIKNLTEELNKVNKSIDGILKGTVKDCGLILDREFKIHTPVDTGNLRGNWNLSEVVGEEPNNYKVELFNPVFYAEYVNYGHRLRNGNWWEGFHFVENAETLVGDSLDDLIKLNIEKHIKTAEGVE